MRNLRWILPLCLAVFIFIGQSEAYDYQAKFHSKNGDVYPVLDQVSVALR